ncbi:MAG: hypothetical protein HUK09_07840, partial [Bacteroidaceae bacterium]|nr:hypothetical protein [Bacteroidaceae bacterium]
MARPSLRQFILLIALSISVMLGLLGLWIGRDWGVQRAEAEARIASLLTTADLQEIFVRANRQRAAEHVLFYLPSTARLEQLVHTDEPIAPLADEMRRTLHSSIDAWLPIVPAMTDSIFRSLLAANQLRADYRLQLIDAVNGDTLFGVVHRYHAWHNLAFT